MSIICLKSACYLYDCVAYFFFVSDEVNSTANTSQVEPSFGTEQGQPDNGFPENGIYSCSGYRSVYVLTH